MKKKKLAIWSVIAILVVGIAVWRLWPRSIDSMLGRPLEEIDQLTCHLTTPVKENDWTAQTSYDLVAETPEESRTVLDILRGGKCQVCFTNLLPWTWGSLTSGHGYDGRNIIVTLLCDGEKPWAATLIFYGNDKGSVDGRQVNPIGNDMFNELAEYIRENGILQED